MKMYMIHADKSYDWLAQNIRNSFAAVRVGTWTEQEIAYAGSAEAVIDASDVVVAILSPVAVQSPYVNEELSYALQMKEELVVPVIAEATAVPFDVPNYVDMRDAQTPDAFRARMQEVFEMIYDPFLERGQEAYDEAESAYEEEANFTTRCNFARVCIELGDFVKTLGGKFAFDRAKSNYLKALELSAESDDEYPCFNSRWDMAISSLALGDLACQQYEYVAQWLTQAVSWYKDVTVLCEQNLREQPDNAGVKQVLRYACDRLYALLKDSKPDEAAAWKQRRDAIN